MNTRVRTQKNSNTEELNPEELEHRSNAEEFEHNRSNMMNALRQDHKQEREKSPRRGFNALESMH